MKSHLILSSQILNKLSYNPVYCVFSTLPALDSKPAHFHRMYCHTIYKLQDLIEAAEIVFCSKKEGSKRSYELRRLQEELPSIYNLLDGEYLKPLGIEPTNIRINREAEVLAVMSHLYFDLFNNPVQPFLPKDQRCSGQWEFWKRINLIKFKETLYSDYELRNFHKFIADETLYERFENCDSLRVTVCWCYRIIELISPQKNVSFIASEVRRILEQVLGDGRIITAEMSRSYKEYEVSLRFEKLLIDYFLSISGGS